MKGGGAYVQCLGRYKAISSSLQQVALTASDLFEYISGIQSEVHTSILAMSHVMVSAGGHCRGQRVRSCDWL